MENIKTLVLQFGFKVETEKSHKIQGTSSCSLMPQNTALLPAPSRVLMKETNKNNSEMYQKGTAI